MPGTPDTITGAKERLKRVLARSESHPAAVSGELMDWLREDRAALAGAVAALVREDACPEHVRFLADFLPAHDLFPFCDPALASAHDEIGIARRMASADPLLDIKLARRLSPRAEAGDAARNERILALLGEISDGSRILPKLVQLLQDANPRVRSKAALLVGRCRDDPDARVRANGVQGLWRAAPGRARPELHAAARDPDNRVAGNSLLGLYRMGEAASIPAILRMASGSDRRFRSTAVWIMEQTGDPRFLPALRRIEEEYDRGLRFQALRAMAAIRRATAQRSGKGSLAVRAAIAGPGLLRVEVAGMGELPELPATCFTVYEESQPVSAFAVSSRACGGKGSTARGLALEYCYEIRYEPRAEARKIRVAVCCEAGYGEARTGPENRRARGLGADQGVRPTPAG